MRKAILYLKKSDPVMRAIIERIGPYRIVFGEPTFHSLAEAIVYQQLNGKAALTIFNRFSAVAGNPLTPEGILKLTPEQMRSVGLSKQKSACDDLTSCRPAISESVWRCTNIISTRRGRTVQVNHRRKRLRIRRRSFCPSQSRWKKSRKPGCRIEASLAGICGRVST